MTSKCTRGTKTRMKLLAMHLTQKMLGLTTPRKTCHNYRAQTYQLTIKQRAKNIKLQQHSLPNLCSLRLEKGLTGFFSSAWACHNSLNAMKELSKLITTQIEIFQSSNLHFFPLQRCKRAVECNIATEVQSSVYLLRKNRSILRTSSSF